MMKHSTTADKLATTVMEYNYSVCDMCKPTTTHRQQPPLPPTPMTVACELAEHDGADDGGGSGGGSTGACVHIMHHL